MYDSYPELLFWFNIKLLQEFFHNCFSNSETCMDLANFIHIVVHLWMYFTEILPAPWWGPNHSIHFYYMKIFREKKTSYCDHLGNCTPESVGTLTAVIPLIIKSFSLLLTSLSCFQADGFQENLQAVAYIVPTAFFQILVQLFICTFLERWSLLSLLMQSIIYAGILRFMVGR